MSLKSAIVSRVAAYYTGKSRQEARRTRAEAKRRADRRLHCVDYFHQADDPYSHLTAQVLDAFASRYDIVLRPHLVSAPADWAAPERDRLVGYSRRDAAALAARAGLSFTDPGRQPPAAAVAKAEQALATALEEGTFLSRAGAIGDGMWSGTGHTQSENTGTPFNKSIEDLKKRGDAMRHKLGHYLGATFHYEGEWYWGIDRLHHLEERLHGLCARNPGAPSRPIFEHPSTPDPTDSSAGGRKARETLHYFLSFRSPYTYIAAERAKALADAYGTEMKLQFVLPMVMRGLPVPPAKRTYISLDVAREARRLDIPFGRVADPVGGPTERGYSLLPWAIGEGRGYDYALAFMRGVWSEGIDAGSDAGLRRIVEKAGLNWAQAKPLVGNGGWRAEAEANRLELLDLGLWGVPSFRVGTVSTWGQDRLWIVEQALKQSMDRS